LDRSFKGLYGDGTIDEDEQSGIGSSDGNFIRIYGWHYTCKLIAAQENIRGSEVFDLTTLEFLNAMAYMKAKNSYDREQNKKLR